MVAFAGIRVNAAAEVVGAEVAEPVIRSCMRCQTMTRMGRPMAAMARFFASSSGQPPVAFAKEGSVLPTRTAASPRTRAR